MPESNFRMFLVLCAGVGFSILVGSFLDKLLPKSRLRDSLLTGALIYISLTLYAMWMRGVPL
jgi:hypothetical protein